MAEAPRVPLRRRLLLLAAAGLVPVVIMSGVGLYALARQQRIQAERIGLELARALATAVDAELRSSISVLQSLAATVEIDPRNLAAFRQEVQPVLETQPTWAGLFLADPSGHRLVDTRFPLDATLPTIFEAASFERVVRTRAATVGGLARGLDGVMLFAVRAPVLRAGRVQYVLTALVKPDGILNVITRQRVPRDWIISIFDANGLRVARSRSHAETLGGRASESLRTLMATSADEGVGQTTDLEGGRNYASFSRLGDYGWTVAPGIAAGFVEGVAYRSLAIYGSGILLSVVLGVLGTLMVAHSVSRPMEALRGMAKAMGRREPAPSISTPIQEIHDVADALIAAARERTSAETEREHLLRREQDARATAEAASRAKDEFLAVLSHELRTPLNAVYGWARLLQSGQVRDQEAARAIDAIVRNANAQVQLIDDLLDVSRVISGKMRLEVQPVDLRAVIESALDGVRPAAESKGIRIQPVLDPTAPIAGDPNRLQQVVWNLLMNAVKFTPKGGRVQIHLQRVNSHVEIVVSDTGQGVAPHILPSIFDRFTQADSSSTRAHSGLGLGLALVKHLVELHGGSVTARSPGEGQGATFVVALPLSIVSIPAGAALRHHPTADTLEPSLAGVRLDALRVLVVDDDPQALDLAATILTNVGADVKTCGSAPDAMAVLQTWRPDVLVSDIEMPGEDGYTLIRKVRALDHAQGGNTPAIALSAYGRTQDRTRSLTAGYSMHVPKPVDPGELTAIVASVAGRAFPTGGG